MSSERILSLLGLFVLFALAVAVGLYKPGTTVLLPPCPFHELTGLFCPGCGSTRMFYYLVHGEFGQAIRQNPLAFVALPFVVAALINGALPPSRRRRITVGAGFFHSQAWPVSVLAVLVAFTVLRNIPLWPMCWLAPGGC